jgi:homoserine trans-succinylase
MYSDVKEFQQESLENLKETRIMSPVLTKDKRLSLLLNYSRKDKKELQSMFVEKDVKDENATEIKPLVKLSKNSNKKPKVSVKNHLMVIFQNIVNFYGII